MDAASDHVHVEFAINFSDQRQVDKIGSIIESKGLKLISSSLQDGKILVEISIRAPNRNDSDTIFTSSFDVQSLQKQIEQQTGLLVVVKGLGAIQAAVAELLSPPRRTNQIFGVVRFSQLKGDLCYVDGSIEGQFEPPDDSKSSSNSTRQDGYSEDDYSLTLAIHEFGDLSGDNFDAIGDAVVELSDLPLKDIYQKFHVTFQKVVPKCGILEMLGKSVALTAKTKRHITNGIVLSAAVLARASEVSNNDKKVCACSGKTIWDERQRNL